jgi:hypothetical protein
VVSMRQMGPDPGQIPNRHGTAASVMSTTSGRARSTVSLGVLMLLNVT